MGSRRQAREIAFKALYSWDLNPGTPLDDLSWYFPGDISDDVHTFASSLIEGVLHNIEVIDNLIGSQVSWDLERIARVDLAILRMSVFSLKFREDIPRAVVIDEAVHISKMFGMYDSYKFINGVLDSVK